MHVRFQKPLLRVKFCDLFATVLGLWVRILRLHRLYSMLRVVSQTFTIPGNQH